MNSTGARWAAESRATGGGGRRRVALLSSQAPGDADWLRRVASADALALSATTAQVPVVVAPVVAHKMVAERVRVTNSPVGERMI